MDGSQIISVDGEAQQISTKSQKTTKQFQGGWITFPFIIATMAGVTLGAGGWTVNLIVYLIEEFNVNSIDAAQISNIVNGCITLFPIIGAVIADSFLGSFLVISLSSLTSLLGIGLLTMTATLDSWRPPPCQKGSSFCVTPSVSQFAILYLSMALAGIGIGGTRFTLGTMGADQYPDNPRRQGVFFNWYFFTMYMSVLVSVIGIIYVQDNVSWAWGFGLCLAANVIGLVVFVSGRRYYRLVKPRGSPFTSLAHVVVAAARKRKLFLSVKTEDYCCEQRSAAKDMAGETPTTTFKFLNHAALIMEGDTNPDGSIAKPWNLCTVRQVEDLKTLLRIFPLWTTGIFLSTPLGIQMSLIVLQALTMDRYLGPHLRIPAGTTIVFILISTSLSLTVLDRFLFPLWKKITGQALTPLQRVGFGHILNVVSMAVSALVESKRLETMRSHQVPISVFWLVPPMVVAGIGEAFHFPGQVALYYQEFPVSLKSTSTAVVALFMGISYYLGTAIVDFIRKTTGWLPNDINKGRVDNVYWLLAVAGALNFGYYLLCSWFYKYQNAEKVGEEDEDI